MANDSSTPTTSSDAQVDARCADPSWPVFFIAGVLAAAIGPDLLSDTTTTVAPVFLVLTVPLLVFLTGFAVALRCIRRGYRRPWFHGLGLVLCFLGADSIVVLAGFLTLLGTLR